MFYKKDVLRKIVPQMILPVIISVILMFSGDTVMVEYVRSSLLKQHKEHLKDLVFTKYKQIEGYHQKVLNGDISREEAQQILIQNIFLSRYGEDFKDYFWLISDTNTMLSHPYFKDSASMYAINPGFMDTMAELSELAREKGEGYSRYYWQWKDNKERVEEKMSYVKYFEPWGWVLGTGFYITEINEHIRQITDFIIKLMGVLIVILALLYIIMLRRSVSHVKEIFTQESKFNESEIRFRKITENMSSGVLVMEDDEITFCNSYFYELLELDKPVSQDFSLLKYAVLEEVEVVRQKLEEVFENKEESEYSFWINTEKGRSKYIMVRFIFVVGQTLTTALMISDITAEKLKSDDIQIMLQTLGQSPDSIVMTDLKGYILYVNESFVKLTGYSIDEVKGKHSNILKSGKMHPTVYKDLWESITKGHTWENEMINKKKNGELHWEQTKIFPIRDKKGNIIRFATIKTDITNKKKLEKELKEAQERASSGDKLKNAFLKNISHEVNTPLNAIFGFSNLLKNNPALSEKDVLYIDTVCEGANTLINLFNDIIEYSSIESGNIDIARQDISISGLLKEIEGKHNRNLIKEPEKKVCIKAEIPAEYKDARLLCDMKWLSRVFDELVSNAIKFSEEGIVVITFKINMETIDFSVKDPGVGISPKEQNKIFDLFTHGENLFLSLHKGTGVGLNIVRLLIQHMGGKLWFNSKEGVGSEFRFSFPSIDVSNYNVFNEQMDETFVSNTLKDKVVVIAEDNDYSFNFIKSKIDKDISNLVRVESDNELFNLLDKQINNVDIILADMYIGYPTSKSMVRAIRNSYNNVPVILMSSVYGDSESMVNDKYCRVISKSFSRFELLSAILSLLK